MPLSNERSAAAFARAKQAIPGGVDSPVRAFGAVGGTPLFVQSGAGCRLTDVDGTAYIDYVMSWGPLILGHAHPAVVAAVKDATARGTSFGAPTETETELAERVRTAFPSIDRVRFVSSGTEATMSAVRLARAFTKRDRIIKFDGGYHGHADSFLVRAGSGALTHGHPDSAGVPEGTARETLSLPYNDLDIVEAAFRQQHDAIAAVIVEPYAANMGLVLPRPGYLAGLRALTERYGALLIFDEVITGFRVAFGGAQEREGIRADLTTLGKILGGGLPAASFGGRADVMALVAPEGPVYQAGTLSGNPLAMAAGNATLSALQEPGVYERLERTGARLADGLGGAFERHNVPHTRARAGSLLGFFFNPGPVVDLASAKASDTAFYARFFHAMLARGVYFAPSQFEAAFVSLAHGDAEIDATIVAAGQALAECGYA